MAYVLNEPDIQRLQNILSDLLVQSESDDCLLCDSGGYVLAEEGSGRNDPYLVSALGAGVFAASRELAKILGENDFSTVFHQGDKKSISIKAVNRDVLLVTIFSNAASLGLVKLYIGPAAKAMADILEEVNARGATAQTDDHRQFTLATEGQIFKTTPA